MGQRSRFRRFSASMTSEVLALQRPWHSMYMIRIIARERMAEFPRSYQPIMLGFM